MMKKKKRKKKKGKERRGREGKRRGEEEELTSDAVSTEDSANSTGSFELGRLFGITPVEAKVLRLWVPISAHHWPQLVS